MEVYWPKRELIFKMFLKLFSCVYISLADIFVANLVEIHDNVFALALSIDQTGQHFHQNLKFDLLTINIGGTFSILIAYARK